MAYTRASDTEVRGDGLDVFVDGVSKSLSRQIALRNNEEEQRFLKSVLEDNLSTEDQYNFRKEQYKRVSDDRDERLRVGKEVAALKQLVEQRKFSDAYTEKLVGLESGASSVESVLTWLRDQLNAATDDTTIAKIESEIVNKEREKFDIGQRALVNQTQYALADKTDSILDNQITRINGEKNKALLSGNKELETTYDLHLQALNKAKQENAIEKDIKNFSVANITGYANSTGMLDSYNAHINAASTTGSVKIGDVTYASPQEFWKFKRDSFVADQSGNGFFGRFTSEQKNALTTRNSQNLLNATDLQTVTTNFNNLAMRPELQGYQQILGQVRQDVVQAGADMLADNVVYQYSYDNDINKAVQGLTAIKASGANVDSSFNKIVQAAAQLKTQQAANIKATMDEIFKTNPGISLSEAFGQAVKQGAAVIFTPQDLINKSDKELADEAERQANSTKYTSDHRVTWDPVTQKNYYAANPYLLPGDPLYGKAFDVDGKPYTPSPNNPFDPNYGKATNPDTTTGAPQPTAQNPQAQPGAAPVATAPTQPKKSVPITSQFDLGATDVQIRELQKFLNSKGYTVASGGQPGSAGFETDYFGPATQAALKKFQAAQGIVSTGDALSTGYGRLGPQTLAKIAELY
jgi:hypothetical protein